MSWARRALSRPGRAKSLGRTPLRAGFSRSMASMASSTVRPIVGWGAWALRWLQRASRGTQKMLCGLVLVGVLGVGAFGSGGRGGQVFVLGLERVADVLEEDEPENDVLVLGGVHVVAQGVGRLPELGFEAGRGGGVGVRHSGPPARGAASSGSARTHCSPTSDADGAPIPTSAATAARYNRTCPAYSARRLRWLRICGQRPGKCEVSAARYRPRRGSIPMGQEEGARQPCEARR